MSDLIINDEPIVYSNYCVFCFPEIGTPKKRACVIFKGMSLCEDCLRELFRDAREEEKK
jgi:hypothetical protein